MTEGESPVPEKETAKDSSAKDGSGAKGSSLRAVILAVLLLGVAVAAWSLLGRRAQPVLPGLAPSAIETTKPSKAPAVRLPKMLTPAPTNEPATEPPGLAALEQRLRALEQTQSASGASDGLTSGALQNLEARVSELETQLTQLPLAAGDGIPLPVDAEWVGRLADLEQRLATTEQRGAGPLTSLAFSLGLLRAAVAEGRPFGMDLDRVSALAGQIAGPGSSLVAAIDRLRGYATTGVPTRTALTQQLAATAGAIVSAAGARPDGDWTERVRARLSSVVTVRRTGDQVGDTPEARVARAETRLKEGDVVAAVAEISLLNGNAGAVASPWLAAARAQITAEEGLSAIEASVADAIAQPNRGDN
jgi:hypothetical protein